MALGGLAVFGLIDVNPISTEILGGVTGDIGLAQQLANALLGSGNRNDTHAHGNTEPRPRSEEGEVMGFGLDFVGDDQCLIQVAVFQQ